MQRTIINLETEKLFDALNKNESNKVINKLLTDKDDLTKLKDNVDLTALKDNTTLIQLSARKHRWNIVQDIIKLKKQVTDADEERFGDALRYAVIDNQDKITKALLKANASTSWFSTKNGNRILHSDCYIENDKKEIPLEIALNKSYWDCAKVFLEDKSFTFKNKAHRNERDEGFAFIRAVGDGELEVADALLAAGVNNNIITPNGNNVLHHVVRQWNSLKHSKRIQTTLYALNHGGNQTAVNHDGKTPIELAGELGHWDCVKLLLENSYGQYFNHDAKSLHLDNVLINAIKDNQYHITELLLEKGAKCNVIDEKGNIALYWAIQNKNYQITALLLKHRADCNIIGENGNMPLYWAMQANQPNLFSLLLEHKANPKLKDKGGNDTIDLARACLNPVFLRYLNEKNYTISEKDMNVDNLVKTLSNRIKLFDNTYPPKYKQSVQQYMKEANICIMALSVNRVKPLDFPYMIMVIKHNLRCVKEIVNHYSKTLSPSDTLVEDVSKETELLTTINNLFNNGIPYYRENKPQVEKCLKEKYQTQLGQHLSIYLNHLAKIIDYVERLKNYLEDLNKRIGKTWWVTNTNLITYLVIERKWVEGVPKHIQSIQDKLKVLSSDNHFFTILNLYKEVLKELANIKVSPYRHPETAQFYLDELKSLQLINFIPQKATVAQLIQEPKAESLIAEQQTADKQPQRIDEQSQRLIEQELQKTVLKKKIISPLSLSPPSVSRTATISIYPDLTQNQLENTNNLLDYQNGTEYKRPDNNLPEYPIGIEVNPQVLENANNQTEYPNVTNFTKTEDPYGTKFANMFPPVPTHTLPRLYSSAPHATLYQSLKPKRQEQAVIAEQQRVSTP
jgi:ankyrin repeat protein